MSSFSSSSMSFPSSPPSLSIMAIISFDDGKAYPSRRTPIRNVSGCRPPPAPSIMPLSANTARTDGGNAILSPSPWTEDVASISPVEDAPGHAATAAATADAAPLPPNRPTVEAGGGGFGGTTFTTFTSSSSSPPALPSPPAAPPPIPPSAVGAPESDRTTPNSRSQPAMYLPTRSALFFVRSRSFLRSSSRFLRRSASLFAFADSAPPPLRLARAFERSLDWSAARRRAADSKSAIVLLWRRGKSWYQIVSAMVGTKEHSVHV
mmetsp:Transcript_19525/g.36590  ORF Transcript_19525/g.36590 Transcript_19525/m.36590 type:complete len:264 (+) Transcript_19525:1490-2281(+)